MPLPRGLARFNRRVTNKVLGPLARLAGPFVIIVHRGRRSGHEYRTPVWAFRARDGFVVALTYGAASTEWVKNVLANGNAKLLDRSGICEVHRPRLIHDEEGLKTMPAFTRPVLRALRVVDFLLLQTTGRMNSRVKE